MESPANASESVVQYAEWQPPIYHTDSPPALAFSSTSLSLTGASVKSKESFYRSAKWAPDGSCALATTEDRSFQLLSLSANHPSCTLNGHEPLPQAASILESAWYPTASAQNSASFCFVASIRDCPVKLLNASDGRLRASYKIVDHRERFVAPHSISFDPTMSKLYCGCEDFIEIFDVQQPGEGTRLHTSPSKKSKDGLKGIISALSFSPDYSGTFAAATYSTTQNAIAIFDPDIGSGAAPTMFLGGVRPGGVTQLRFHPTRPHVVYAASRRSEYIQCWDLRNPMMVEREFHRGGKVANTNQRLRFDIDLSGKWLCAGNEDGFISMFDILAEEESAEPTLFHQAHQDAIGSTSFHPLHSLLLTVAGARHFEDIPSDPPGLDLDSDSDSDSSSGLDEFIAHPTVKDASVKLWDFTKESSASFRA